MNLNHSHLPPHLPVPLHLAGPRPAHIPRQARLHNPSGATDGHQGLRNFGAILQTAKGLRTLPPNRLLFVFRQIIFRQMKLAKWPFF